jgi:hypothetical protein
MSVAELQRIVSSEREDYVPRALELAEEELARRGGAASEDGGPVPPPRATRRVRAPRWWHIWITIVATFALGFLVLGVALGDSWLHTLYRMVTAAIFVPLALLLRKPLR